MRKSTQAARAPSVGQQPVESTIGIDLGDRWSRYCVLDGAGGSLKKTVCVPARKRSGNGSASALSDADRDRDRNTLALGKPASWRAWATPWWWPTRAKLRMIYESDRKNDRLDARMLARLGRLDVSCLPRAAPQRRNAGRPGRGARPRCPGGCPHAADQLGAAGW